MPDNEAVEEQEVDLVTLLATQSEQETEEVEDEYTPVDELPSDPNELRDLLLREREIKSKRNKTLKKRDEAIHRMQEQMDAQNKRIEELMSTGQPAQDNSAQTAEWKETQQKWRDSVAENPELGIDYANMQANELKTSVVDLITDMKSEFSAQLAELKAEQNPEKVKYRDKLNMLRQNPDFANVDDATGISIIKGLEKAPVAPRGSVAGRRPTSQSADDKLKELKKQAAEFQKSR